MFTSKRVEVKIDFVKPLKVDEEVRPLRYCLTTQAGS